jgi:hypothetical protein
VEYYDRGITSDLQLLGCQTHVVTVLAVPCVFLVQLFRLVEELEAVVDVGFS